MLHLLYDFVPVLLFFAAFKLYGIYVATLVGIVATLFQVGLTAYWKDKIDKQQFITLIVFMVFGGMTLYFHNPIFVKWKPTVVFWIFGIVFLLSHFIGQKPLIQRMMEPIFEQQSATLPQRIWRKLSVAWTTFFVLLGAINIYIAYHFSTDIWVNFKVYGIMGLVLLFSIAQSFYLSRHMTSDK